MRGEEHLIPSLTKGGEGSEVDSLVTYEECDTSKNRLVEDERIERKSDSREEGDVAQEHKYTVE